MTTLYSCIPHAVGKARDRLRLFSELSRLYLNTFLRLNMCFPFLGVQIRTIQYVRAVYFCMGDEGSGVMFSWLLCLYIGNPVYYKIPEIWAHNLQLHILYWVRSGQVRCNHNLSLSLTKTFELPTHNHNTIHHHCYQERKLH